MVSMKIKFAALTFSLAAVLLFSSAANGSIGEWHNYTYSNNSNDIVSSGQVIWCATSGGLIKYDQQTGQAVKYLNSDGLGDVDLLSIEVDTAGTLYAGGTNGTLTRIFSDGRIEIDNFQYTNNVLYHLLSLYADGEVLWVGTEVGVAQFSIYRNGGEFKETYANLGDIPRETPVRALRVVGNYLWAGTDSGLAYIDKDNPLPQNPDQWGSVRSGENGLTESRIQAINYIDDTLYIGTSNGVFWMDQDSLWHNMGPVSTSVRDIRSIGNNIYMAANNGVYRKNGMAWNLITSDSLITHDAKALAADNNDSLWAAFVDGGFASFNGSYWDVVTIPGPAASYINSLAMDSTGNIWLAHTIPGFSGPAGVSKFNYDNSTWQNYNYQNSSLGINGAVVTLYDDVHKLMWFGSWGDGLFSFDSDTTWVHYNENNSPLRGLEAYPFYVPIPDLSLDDNGNLWIMNLKAYNPENTILVFNAEDSTWQAYFQSPQQIATNFQQVIYTHGDTVYVAGETQNINRLEFNNPFITSDDNWLSQIQDVEQIKDMAMDNSGKLFIATAAGLFYYDFNYNNTVNIELPDGYRSACWSIAIDGLGNKWVGTDSGVVVLGGDLDQGTPLWKDKFKKSNSYLVNNSVRGIVVDKENGLVYIATVNGLSVYESQFVAPSPDLSDMSVYPNPIYADQADAVANFLRVPDNADVYIYTVAGELIKKFNTGTLDFWDLRNDKGNKVAAGIYFFHVRAGDKSGRGKFAIIR